MDSSVDQFIIGSFSFMVVMVTVAPSPLVVISDSYLADLLLPLNYWSCTDE